MDGMEVVSIPWEAILPLKVFTSTGAAGVTIYDVRPPEGELWSIVDIIGSHDGAAARDIEWNFSDQIAAVSWGTLAALAASTLNRFRQQTGYQGKLILSHQTMVTFRVPALAAGEHWTVRALYHILRGVPVYVNV